MKKNMLIIMSVIMLFVLVFFFSNWHYYSNNNLQMVHQGVVKIEEEQLQKPIKLEGDWAFYPNVLIPSWEKLDNYKNKQLTLDIPFNWDKYVEPNEEGLAVGTYHVKIKVPTEGVYGLYIRSIRQASRVFINGIEVGAKGKASTVLSEYEAENDDKYTVYAKSDNNELNIVIHVVNYNVAQSGIVYPIEFGTEEVIQQYYNWKVFLDALVSIGHIVIGIVYIFTYVQNRKRIEELFFGLFTISLGFYMSFINQKIFFLLFSDFETVNQLRLQLGSIPIALLSLTLFIYSMYPQLQKRKVVYMIVALLGIVFVFYGIYNPITKNERASSDLEMFLRKIIYISITAPIVFYNVGILIQVMLNRLEGVRYMLIVISAICCYTILLVFNFLIGVPIDYTEFVLFLLILFGFASLLNYRANQAFEKIQTLSEELLAHNQMKDEFLLKTSHELRTPLNGILNLSKTLMEGAQGPLKRTQQEQVILIHNVTQRLGHFVEDLLFSSNQMIGEVRVSLRHVPIDVINEVVEEIRSVMPKNSQVSLHDEVDLSLPAILTDELRFKQVLYNLLHNAMKYTENGEIVVTAYVRAEHMVIQVSDTGAGIPAQDLDRIFNAFYQVNNQHKKEGLGLGLSITKNIVEKLNGDIHVTSTLGQGTTFTFTMPLATGENVSLDQPPIVTHTTTEVLQLNLPLIRKGNDKKILVVDDNHTNIKALADALAVKGYTVIAVDNGFDAVDYIKNNKVDCMLIDLMMNGMSGYELCKRVRKHYDMLELPIIILTAIMKHSDLVLSLKVGANDYLQKPVSTDELFIRIESLLAVRQSSIDAIEVEMNYLYSQVTPHFVYNTLNTIIGLSYTDMDNTREALYCLATYFRAKLNVYYRNSFVSVDEEMELVKAYLYIEKMRFGDRLTIKYDIDESINLMIPALSIQPLVENAVFHGISKKQEGGTVEISVQREGQFVCIKIYDNGVGIPEEKLQLLINEESTRIGFMNPLKKFKLMKNASLRLYSEEGKGTTIVVLLPEGGGV
ncbi:response regulator [Lysinibacillus fusiformis]|uniref:sensor histidine kinase n=1 Tax=Lysinibacillus fusiformis TaxID=28031 RepID=UPI0019682B13|nr:ATP-binding protein [Lysinibacillus fusiformis]QSB09242.1 response regulator [Lysinibacillus fusiformis]